MRRPPNIRNEGNSLIKNLKPVLHDGAYVFCFVEDTRLYKDLPVVGSFMEEEGLTLILRREDAEKHGLEYYYTGAWITLRVQSSLTSVGLTAAVSSVLAQNRITCNMVAGYHHDHVFVDYLKSDEALQLLRQLSNSI